MTGNHNDIEKRLAKKLIEVREEARKLGIFTDDRELLECPKCGLWEEVSSQP